MARISGPKRGRHAAKRMDMGPLQQWVEALMARKQYAVMAKVVRPSATEEHYELVLVDSVLVDIVVEVETIPDRVPLTCSLATGDRWIPQLGDTVVVVLPAGQIDFVPTIVAVLPPEIPNPPGQGPALNRRILVADEVLVHDGSGGAEPLVRRSEFVGHTHGPGTYTTPSGNVTGFSGGADDITGTTVLKAK